MNGPLAEIAPEAICHLNPLETEIVAGAIRALRNRAAARRASAQWGLTVSAEGVRIVTSEARADLDFADDLDAVATEIEREGVR